MKKRKIHTKEYDKERIIYALTTTTNIARLADSVLDEFKGRYGDGTAEMKNTESVAYLQNLLFILIAEYPSLNSKAKEQVVPKMIANLYAITEHESAGIDVTFKIKNSADEVHIKLQADRAD